MERGVLSRRGILALMALSSLVGACGGTTEGATPSPSPSVTPAGPPLLEVVARVPVGGEPIGIIDGFDSVWVVSSEFDSGGTPSVSRIDPASASVESIRRARPSR